MFGLCNRCVFSPTEGADWVVTTSHFNLLEKFHFFFACSGPVILIFNKLSLISFYYNL
jgi:hypothetical protein